MPKKQTTAGKKARAAARTGEKFTRARREADRAPEPPRVYPIVSVLCPSGCDGTAHPNALCWLWRPEDSQNVQHKVQRTAQLPTGRAAELADRYEPRGDFHGREASWLLALVYSMLTDQHPELLPGRAELRAAVETDAQEAVDAVMEPLDRAAARLLTKDSTRWWGEVKPLLDEYAATVENEDKELLTWQEIDDRQRVDRLVRKWRQAWEKTHQNMHGFWEAPGVMWVAPKGWLDALLAARHHGHAPGFRVRLADGRPAIVYAAEWGEDGPPTAYRVHELVPGKHGNEGRLVPTLKGNGEIIPAPDCQPLD